MPEPVSEASRLLGIRLRDFRQKQSCTQDDIANLAGVNPSNYGKMERGLGNPEFHTLVRLAHVLNVDVAELVAGITADQLPEKPHVFTAKDFVRERTRRDSSA
jgi:transcriptional regulator with XRE-family HTH domain